jgi:hypothetical protein
LNLLGVLHTVTRFPALGPLTVGAALTSSGLFHRKQANSYLLHGTHNTSYRGKIYKRLKTKLDQITIFSATKCTNITKRYRLINKRLQYKISVKGVNRGGDVKIT